jgi:hypothetical protein
MSLLPSHLRRAELVRFVSGGRCTAIGCCLFLLVSCSFDSAPRAAERTSAVIEVGSDAALASDTGAARGTDGAALEQDDAGGPMDAGKRPITPTTTVMTREGSMAAAENPKDAGSKRDAGEPAKPNAGGGGAPAPVDAGAARDAGRTMQPLEPDPHCKEGIYAGTFSGSIQLIGLSLSTVTGTVRAELMLNPAGTYLEIRDARVVGVDQDGNTLTVDLSGNLNCMSDALEDGTLANGVYHNVASNSDTLFTGEAQATYSEDPHSVVGTFTVVAEGLVPLFTGRGTWSLIIND